MFVLIVMLVVFFIVAISSWWLDDFGEAENERIASSLGGKENNNCSSPISLVRDKPIIKNATPTRIAIHSQQQATPALAGCSK